MKWDAALDSETLLKKSSLERMWTPASLAKGKPATYGFGWEIGKVNGHRRLSHGGGIPGFTSQLARFVDDKLTVIVLANSDQCNSGALAQGVARRIVPALTVKPPEPIADSDPKTTERLRTVLIEGQKGEVDPKLFTEAAKKTLVGAIKEIGKNQLGPLGELKSFRLVERQPMDKSTRLRYRAEFEKMSMYMTFVLDESGKIAQASKAALRMTKPFLAQSRAHTAAQPQLPAEPSPQTRSSRAATRQSHAALRGSGSPILRFARGARSPAAGALPPAPPQAGR